MKRTSANSIGPDQSVPAEQQYQLDNKAAVAKAVRVSERTVDNWVKQRKIPSVLLSPRCRKYHLPSVMAALLRHTVKEVQ